MIRAISIRILRQVLLVIVGAEGGISIDSDALRNSWPVAGRLSVDVAANPPVGHATVQFFYHRSVQDLGVATQPEAV